MVFAATDYEGLGTPGRHPYIVGESEARGTLDIVRAAQQLERSHGRVRRGRALGPLAGRARGAVRQPDRRGVGARARRGRHRGRRTAVAAPADRRRPARQPLPLLPGHGGRGLGRRLPGGRPVTRALAAGRSSASTRSTRAARASWRPRGTTLPTKTSSPPIPTTSNRGSHAARRERPRLRRRRVAGADHPRRERRADPGRELAAPARLACAASARWSSAAPIPGRATPASSARRSPTCSSGSTPAWPARKPPPAVP